MRPSILQQLNSLNSAQRQAVMAPFGNHLVLAGAGSGKTRVLTHRIVWFVENEQVSPYSILAVTFTNKAAREMQGRLNSLLGQDAAGMWVGTFHGLAHKFLRLHWNEAKLPSQFQVLDSDDQLQLIRRIFKLLNISEERFEPKKVQSFINRKKDEGLRSSSLPPIEGSYDEVMKQVYQSYEKICVEQGCVDFAEILLKNYEVLQQNPELLNHYQTRFLHFFVDEFQDTNTIQYKWLSLLAGQAQSVTVVGDDDQSIYGWRGAKIENIRRFEKEFKGTVLHRLEQNYRSTGVILNAANALISHNQKRLGKTLWTEGESGEPITVYSGFNEEDEALYVMRQIRGWLESGRGAQEIGILYRSNAQSRIIEEALIRAGIPYSIYGGLRFFERAEIKDALAYLRLAVNPKEDLAFLRVINVPSRGIGDKSLEKIKELAEFKQISLWEAACEVMQEQSLSGKAHTGLSGFVEFIQSLKSALKTSPLTELVDMSIRDSGLLAFYREQKGEKALNRVENLEELLNATVDFEADHGEPETNPLIDFLSYTALESERTKGESKESVQLMTLHSAKGLEFPFVLICGLEEGLFPHHFSSENPESLEEERRLCYVGITRAMQKLSLSYAEKRRIFGRDEDRCASRFIGEIPSQLLKEIQRKVSTKSYAAFSFSAAKVVPEPCFSQEMEGLCIGSRVIHAKFGEGTIVDQEGMGDRARVHVRFDLHGSKWLALQYAKLSPVTA